MTIISDLGSDAAAGFWFAMEPRALTELLQAIAHHDETSEDLLGAVQYAAMNIGRPG